MDSLKVELFLSNDSAFGRGSGCGYGYSLGCGCGYDSDGYCSGSGCGYGSGRGDGFCGDGYGSGYGLGYGCGCGDGSGSGKGYGFSDDSFYGLGLRRYNFNDAFISKIKSINGMKVYSIDNLNTILTSIKGNVAKGFIVDESLNLKPCYVVKKRRVLRSWTYYS